VIKYCWPVILVKKLKPVCFAEVVGYWLRHEYASRPEFKEFVDSRFSGDERNVIGRKNFGDESDNTKRYDMLHGY
jgi:hypothetical protein